MREFTLKFILKICMETENFNLDVSWLNDLQKISIEEDQLMYEKEPMSDINISFIYINLNNEIHKIITESHEIEIDEEHQDGDPFLSKEYILSLVSNKIKFEKSHYKLFDILLFNVDLESSDISSLSSHSFLKKISILDDIIITKSIPIFHSTNGLFFLFKEISVVKKPSLIISNNTTDFQPDEIISHKSFKTRKHRSLVKHTRKNKK